MKTVTIDARSKKEAVQKCQKAHSWTPEAVRQVDSGGKGKAWMCFQDARDACTWNNQR